MLTEFKNGIPQIARMNPYQTDDLDAARQHIGELFAPHKLEVVGISQKLDVCISRTQIEGGSTFVYHRHGARVRVQPQPLSGFYLLQIPVNGEAFVKLDHREVHCHPNQAVMISPNLGLDMLFSEGCEQLIIRIEKPLVERQLELLLGHPLDSSLSFAPSVPLTNPKAKELISLLSVITMSLISTTGLNSSVLARKQMDSLFLTGLLSCLEHNYSHKLVENTDIRQPAYLSKALNYMKSNLSDRITPDDISAAANVSTRTLHAGFKKFLGTTPMRKLKELRLLQVRQLLAVSDPEQASITNIAIDNGFQHLGHFCTDYKEKFSELPTETLNYGA